MRRPPARRSTHALHQALDQRLRPILIGALTGVLGALPMAINPGPGAVIYRGLAAVSVGGVALSLVFLVVLIPALLRLADSRRQRATAIDGIDADRAAPATFPLNVTPPPEIVMRTLHKTLIAAALAAVLTVPLLDLDAGASAPPPEAPPAIVSVAAAVSTELAPRHWAPGSVISRQDAHVASEQDGRVIQVAEVGQNVRAGEPIAVLDDTALRLREREAQADLARIQAQLDMATRQEQRYAQLAAAAEHRPRPVRTAAGRSRHARAGARPRPGRARADPPPTHADAGARTVRRRRRRT